jgi:putative inorganic carbon (hco3(-)) transporter
VRTRIYTKRLTYQLAERMVIFGRLNLYALWAYMFIVPTYYLPPFFLDLMVRKIPVLKYSFLLFVLGGFVARGYFVLRTSPQSKLSIEPLDFLVLLSIASSFLSLIGSELPLIGLTKLVYHIITGIGICYLAKFFWVKTSEHTFFVLLVCTASIVAGYGIFEYLSGFSPIFHNLYMGHNPYYNGANRASSSLGNPVALGAFLVLSFPFSIYLANKSSASKLTYLFYYPSVLIILFGLVVTFSRGAWLAAVASLGIYLILHRKKAQGKVFIQTVSILLFCSLFVAITDLALVRGNCESFRNALVGRFESLFSYGEDFVFRVSQYRVAFDIFREFPLWGIGFGQYTSLFQKYQVLTIPGINVHTADNIYLMFLIEVGSVGCIVHLFLFFFLLRLFFQCWKKESPPRASLFAAYFSSLSGLLFHMFFWDGLNNPSLRIGFWLLVGVGLATCSNRAALQFGRTKET